MEARRVLLWPAQDTTPRRAVRRRPSLRIENPITPSPRERQRLQCLARHRLARRKSNRAKDCGGGTAHAERVGGCSPKRSKTAEARGGSAAHDQFAARSWRENELCTADFECDTADAQRGIRVSRGLDRAEPKTAEVVPPIPGTQALAFGTDRVSPKFAETVPPMQSAPSHPRGIGTEIHRRLRK